MKASRIIIVCASAMVLVIGLLIILNKATSSYAAASTDLVVDSVIDAVDANPGDGICETADGECTLRAAIQESNALSGTDNIFIPSGIYTRTIGGIGGNDSVGDLNIVDDVNIVGEGRNTTVIDANLLDRVFHIGNMANANVSKITLKHGSTPGIGAGIYIESGASASIDDVVIIENIGGSGAGIEARGPLTLTNSIIAENQALNGNSGGGIVGFDTTIKIINSTIRDNTTTSRGAGIFLQVPGSAELINVTISGNESDSDGGGITNLGMQLSLVNVTVSGNQAVEGGAGIDNHGVITITNSTIFANQSVNSIGGVYNNPINNGSMKVENTIIAGNNGGDCGGTVSTIVSLGNNIISDTTCNFSGNGDLPNTDPLLGTLQDNGGSTLTHALLSGSPAIDNGKNENCPDIDQRGYPRPLDGNGDNISKCDIGAVESGSFVIVSDIDIAEGDESEITATFTITLTGITSQNITITYHTESESAISGVDFVPYTGTLELSPGQVTGTISITIIGDSTYEADETFSVYLDDAQNTNIVDMRGVCTILNDDELFFVFLPFVKKE